VYKTIVVPLDGSRLAEIALPYAEEVAAKTDTDIELLSVFESGEIHENEKHQNYIDRIANVTKSHAKKYLDKSRNESIEVRTSTRVGNPAEAIVDYASKGGLKLIVMATHGRSGISRWAVGSVADKVVRAASRQPVMLIRAKKTRSDLREKRVLKRALVPLDGSLGSRAVIPYISELASRLDMELTLLQVVPRANHGYANAEAYLQNECTKLQEQGITTVCDVRVGYPAEVIIDLANELIVDLVAMSTSGQTGAKFWSLGSVAQKILLEGSTPLLLVKQ